jgi:integrase
MALSATALRNLEPRDKPYKVYDADGLFILVNPNGSVYWRMRYRHEGREKVLALGVYPDVPLTLARERRLEARQLIAKGVDPSSERQERKQKRRVALANTFNAVFNDWWENRQTKTLDPKSERRTKRLFDEDVLPVLGGIPIAEVTADQILAVLKRLQARGAIETSGRVRQKISEVFRRGIATGRCKTNMADVIKGELPTVKAKHHSALTKPKDVGQLMRAVDAYPSTTIVRAALLLSAWWFLRPGELRHCKWSELNWEENILEIPGERMKIGEPHIVPLCRQSRELLEDLYAHHKNGEYILPSPRSNQRPISENAVRVALRSMGYGNDDMTAHGFRATARTLLDEALNYRIEWIEQQLAHTVRDAHGRAYNRTTHLPQRAEMMQAWADYLDELKTKEGK